MTLSPRQSQAADMVLKGMTNAEIAAAMGIKPSSAKELVKQARQRAELPMRIRGARSGRCTAKCPVSGRFVVESA